jgi:hypothetical protein
VTPVLGDQQGRGRDGHEDLDDEDDRGDLRRRTALQRAHLGEQPYAGGEAGGDGPRQDGGPVAAVQRIGDELGRQAAPRQRGPGAEHHQDAAAPPPDPRDERDQHDGAHATEDRGERDRPRVAGRRVWRHGGQQRDAHEDPEDGGSLPRTGALAEVAGGDGQEQHEPERQRRLDDGQRGQQQRHGLQRPAEHVQRRPGQPARAPRQADEQRRVQRLRRRSRPRVERLHREAEVVQR